MAGLAFLEHRGEMAARIAAHDWADNPLGSPEGWPAALRFAVDLMLASTFPTALYWGPDLRLLYNDAWAPIPADRHPWALGRAGGEVWADIWDVVGPQMDRVMATGEGFAIFDQHLPMERDGRPQETFWNYSFTPVRGESGKVLGILNQGNETTRTVLAERARVAEAERLRDLFAQAPGAVALLHGPDHVFEIANPAYLELVGSRDIIGRSVAEALPEVVEQGFITLLHQVFASGETYRADGAEVELVRDGRSETRLLDFVYQPVKDSNGNVTDVFVQATDMTERARAEDSARAVAGELRAANEAQAFVYALAERQRMLDTPAAIMGMTASMLGERLGVDRAGFYRVAGEMLQFGPCWTDGKLPAIGGERPVTMLAGLADGYRAGKTMTMRNSAEEYPDSEISHTSPAGLGVPLLRGGQWVAALYVNSATPRDWRPEEIAFVETVAEISWDAVERADAVLALRESEEKFRGIANSIDQMIWATRPDGFHDYYNDRWYEYTGVPHGSTDGEGWNNMFHPDDQERAWGLWRHCLETGEPYHIEYRLRHHSGTYRWVLGRAQAVRDDAGAITRWFGTCTDIQDIVDAREVLARSREELERAVQERTFQLLRAEDQLRQAQKMESIGQLTGGIAHDFNNMLAVIIGALDLLERRLAQGRTDIDRYLTAARDGATRAAALTSRLLAFSRQQPLAPAPMDANVMVSGMIELLGRTIGEDISIETYLAPELKPALADANQLENVVLNLAVNARDAMPGGGTLTIETANVTFDDVMAQSCGIEPGDFVEIAVRDSGLGMSPEVAERAFDPFFTTKGVGKGTGLGLSQVFGFIRQSGGHVRLESEQDKGTVVRLYLPVHDGPVPAPAPARTPVELPRAKPGEIVMVVEDEEKVRHLSVDALRELGYTVVDARDGPEALRLIEAGQRPDLLFTDIVMPEMTGRELAERALMRLPHLKLLFTSGYSREDAEEAVASEVLAKPFDLDTLALRVRQALDA